MNTDKPQRPECFGFALDFLGDPESTELLAYIEQLEARAALAEPVAAPAGPTDEELWQVGDEDFRANTWCMDAVRYARAVLARYGHHPAPPAAGEVEP